MKNRKAPPLPPDDSDAVLHDDTGLLALATVVAFVMVAALFFFIGNSVEPITW